MEDAAGALQREGGWRCARRRVRRREMADDIILLFVRRSYDLQNGADTAKDEEVKWKFLLVGVAPGLLKPLLFLSLLLCDCVIYTKLS